MPCSSLHTPRIQVACHKSHHKPRKPAVKWDAGGVLGKQGRPSLSGSPPSRRLQADNRSARMSPGNSPAPTTGADRRIVETQPAGPSCRSRGGAARMRGACFLAVGSGCGSLTVVSRAPMPSPPRSPATAPRCGNRPRSPDIWGGHRRCFVFV